MELIYYLSVDQPTKGHLSAQLMESWIEKLVVWYQVIKTSLLTSKFTFTETTMQNDYLPSRDWLNQAMTHKWSVMSYPGV